MRRSCGAERAEIGGAAVDFGVLSVFGLSGVRHSLDSDWMQLVECFAPFDAGCG